MKFINYLESITGIEIYPMISLFIFVVFFLAVTFYVWKGNKQHFNRSANIPLEK